MERALREHGNGSAGSRCVAQGVSGTGIRRNTADSALDTSPFMVAQRQRLQGIFGLTAQRRATGEDTIQGRLASVQRVEEEEPEQGTNAPVQQVAEEEEISAVPVQRVGNEESFQGSSSQPPIAQRQEENSVKSNNTGLPDNLKTGVESLSGISLDNVRVHYNSSHPAQLNALAYAQGTDIHVAPGQERHLPHEAWHVVQQAQGRVQPTMQLKDGVPVNDDAGLEHEADVMGEKASMSAFAHQMKLGDPCSPPSTIVQAVLTRSMWKIVNETTINSQEEFVSVGKFLESKGYGEEIRKEILERIVKKSKSALSGDIFDALFEKLGGYSEEYNDNDEVEMNAIDHGDLGEYDDPTAVDQYISDIGLTVQMARKGNTLSGPKDYTTKNFGGFKQVAYTTDGKGCIDFSSPTAGKTWSDPVSGGSLVDLNNAGKTINTKNRGQHFAIGDYLYAQKTKGKASDTTKLRKGKWTWHHMPTKYQMVLVDMTVHAKHGHNGGVYLW